MNKLIKNKILQAGISTRGAELNSIRSMETDHEYIWQGSSDSWSGSSPLLFPIVGGLVNDTYRFDGKNYSMKSHGFARSMEFTCERTSDSAVRFILESNAQTLEQYPFSFVLSVLYEIVDSTVTVRYQVRNTDSKTMLFSIGAHPGFRCPLEEGLQFDDYELVFDGKETVERRDKEAGVLNGKRHLLLDDSDILKLDHNLFTQDALIFDDLRSERISLRSEKGARSVTMEFKGFPYFGIWSFPGKPQDFVCLEPWFGIDSTQGDSVDFIKKEGLVSLAPNEVFKAGFSITIQ